MRRAAHYETLSIVKNITALSLFISKRICLLNIEQKHLLMISNGHLCRHRTTMNSVTMMFCICLSAWLLLISCDSARPTRRPRPVIVHRFCRTRDIVRVYVRVCPRRRRSLPEETVAHGDEPSMSKRSLQLNTNIGNGRLGSIFRCLWLDSFIHSY